MGAEHHSSSLRAGVSTFALAHQSDVPGLVICHQLGSTEKAASVYLAMLVTSKACVFGVLSCEICRQGVSSALLWIPNVSQASMSFAFAVFGNNINN